MIEVVLEGCKKRWCDLWYDGDTKMNSLTNLKRKNQTGSGEEMLDGRPTLK